ncbi:hypothetical protein DPEC_G00206260 [Dallia pectoralis]|uniref:Uncharacterized protein n=1 Tax=Dallia pectoralis TaxID=75939 RepID=A0ACC2G554_DALPE|nr:hypothetical protein DPEC_G00206260 [Dallia pectoralis]
MFPKLRVVPRKHRLPNPANLHDELSGSFHPGSQQSALAQLQGGVRLAPPTGTREEDYAVLRLRTPGTPASPVKWLLHDSRWRTADLEPHSLGSSDRSGVVNWLGFESPSSGSPSR